MRVQLIRNIGVIEGNAPVSPNEWETIKRNGDSAIKNWINDNLKYKSCLVVLVGTETANRKWVQYEIEKAWSDGKGVLGIYIHNIKCPRNGTTFKGSNPFNYFNINDKSMSSIVKCYDPNSWDAYNHIADNIDSWIEEAIKIRSYY